MSEENRNMNLFIVGSMALLTLLLSQTESWNNDAIRVGFALFFVIIWCSYNSHYFIIKEIRKVTNKEDGV